MVNIMAIVLQMWLETVDLGINLQVKAIKEISKTNRATISRMDFFLRAQAFSFTRVSTNCMMVFNEMLSFNIQTIFAEAKIQKIIYACLPN